MSTSEENWKEEVKKLLAKELAPIKEHLNRLTNERHRSSGGENEVPIYKCKGKDCGYSTDDLNDYITHVVKENLPKPAPTPEPEASKKRHETVDDYLNCPECFPKFEKAFVARGYVKAEEKKPEEKEKKGLF